MSEDRKSKSRNTAAFWRACRFLKPYRGLMVISILCAFFVGAVTTTGLAAMLPVLKVLIRGQTVQAWVDRTIAESRVGATLGTDAEKPKIIDPHKDGWAAKSGLAVGDGLPAIHELAEASVKTVTVQNKKGESVQVKLPEVPGYQILWRDLTTRLPSHPVKVMAVLLGALMALTVLGNVVRFFQEYLSDRIAMSTINDVRRRMYDNVLHLPLGFFSRNGTSDVTSRLVQDTQNLQDGFRLLLGQSIQEPIKAAMGFGAALIISWRLTLFIVLFGPLMFAVIKKLGKKMRRAARAAMQSSSSMLGQIEATLTGIRVVKAATAERFERRRYTGIMSGLLREQFKMARYEAFSTPMVETITMLVVCCIALYATHLVLISHELDSDRFILLLACLGMIAESLRRCSKINNTLQRCNSAAARVFEILDVPTERAKFGGDAAASRTKLQPIQREIRFENLTFAYPGASATALCDVSLTVPKGKSVAVVGRNGSGKTTLLALLPRFYDPQQGRVLIDGMDVRHVALNSLRRQISIVTQETIIFPGTIAQNIAYGLPLAKREDIESAARRAFAHDFIMEKPQGYDTPLDGLGAQLSGGQKQRLCIARAILRQSPILILDEATSQVDAESEHLIQKAIESLMHERTTFVIAHRFSTILSADEIVVMDKGRIVGMGRHEQLLKSCETYQQLYERQLVAPAAG